MNTAECRLLLRPRPDPVRPRRWRVCAGVWLLLGALSMAGCAGSDAPGDTAAADASAPAPVVVAPTETAQSALAQANAAFRANRIVKPAGDSALAHALTAIRLDPRNAGANEIIVDITPIAASAIEVDIKAGELAEAQRVMDLLAAASPDSLIVQNLQRRLEIASRQPEPALVASSAPTAVVPAPASALTSAAPREEAVAQPTAARDAIASAATAGSRQAAADDAPRAPVESPPTTPVPAPPAIPTAVANASTRAGGVSSDPVPLVKFAPEYPAAAKKRRAEGWVELQFVVGTNGVASEIEVVRAQPEGIFDRAAVRALSRWKFKPGERDGEVVEARARTTINFKLG